MTSLPRILLASLVMTVALPTPTKLAAAEKAPEGSFRIALAALALADTIPDGVQKMKKAIAECSEQKVDLVCFSETYLPGLRGGWNDSFLPPPDQPALERALADLQAACREHGVAAIVGMEWVTHRGLENRAFVIDADGRLLGHQTKDQITPGGEEKHYVPEGKRRLFTVKGVPFGIVICHEGWRYPETVRWAAVRGAKIVFQPQVTGGNQDRPGHPAAWGETYYEKAMILRAKENSVWFASVNQAMRRQNSATSLIDPDGELVSWLPYGEEGLLVADLDLRRATGFYASRYRPEFYPEN